MHRRVSGMTMALVMLILFVRPSFADELALARIRQETATLVGTPSTMVPTYAKAQAVRTAILNQDYAGAGATAADILSASHMQSWSSQPFDAFISDAVAVNDETFRKSLDHWVAVAPKDPIALNMRALYWFGTAMARRNSIVRSDRTEAQKLNLRENIAKARRDIEAALQLRSDIPYSYYLQLRILFWSGADTLEFETAYQAAIARFPNYYPLYMEQLRTLAPISGGSVVTMSEFVDRTLAATAEASPLRLLYVELYGQVLTGVSYGCSPWRANDEQFKQCVTNGVRASTPAGLEDKIATTLKLQNGLDPVALAAELGSYLEQMVETSGGEIATGAILQRAAEAMGSDNRQMRDAGLHGSYVLDLVTANAWNKGRYFDNAETKYRHALEDIAATTFPDAEAHNIALARVYDGIAMLADRTGDWPRVIATTDAAIALAGDGPARSRYQECRAYHELKLYDEGARACARRPGNAYDSHTLYWRAMNQTGAGNIDAAISAWSELADLGGGTGSYAVTRLSVIHAQRQEFSIELAIMDAHPYVFDEQRETKQNLAVAYNNRCHAYMELGELRKALDDCNTSLRFGSVPDAYMKQQRLIQLLKDHPSENASPSKP